jgi:hypothetical protein
LPGSIGTEREIDAVFAKLAELQAGGLVIGADNYFNSRSKQLANLAFRHRVDALKSGKLPKIRA